MTILSAHLFYKLKSLRVCGEHYQTHVNKSASSLEISPGECFSWRRIRCRVQMCLISECDSFACDRPSWMIHSTLCNESRAAQTCAERSGSAWRFVRVFALQMIHAFWDHSRCSGNFHRVEAVADSQADIIEIWARYEVIVCFCENSSSEAVLLCL